MNEEPYWSGTTENVSGGANGGFLSSANNFYDKNIEGTMLDTGINLFTDPVKHGYNAVGSFNKLLKSSKKISDAPAKLGVW